MGPVLAIELSQRQGSIALGRPGEVPRVAQFSVGGPQHDDALMPTVDALVRDAGYGPRDLGAIAVSIGPGGFTGLRVATTTAKCMADVLGIPLVAVPSAVVIAAASTDAGEKLVALAAKRDTCWMTRVAGLGQECRIAGRPGIVDASTFDPCGANVLFADEFAPPAIVALAREAGLQVMGIEPQAAACWAVAATMLARGETIDPLRLTPLYPREPEAVTLWRERHG